MKLKTKIAKLIEAEKYAGEKIAEISAEVLDVIQQKNINVAKLCDEAGLSRNSYYHFVEKKCFPSDWLKKISQTEVFKQLDL